MQSFLVLAFVILFCSSHVNAASRDANPCIENVPQAIEMISDTSHNLGFHISSSSAEVRGFSLTQHFQGVQKFNSDEPMLLATGNPGGKATLAMIYVPSLAPTIARKRSPIPVENTVVQTMVFPEVNHIGGVSILGDYVAFPIHVASDQTYKGSRILFYDFANTQAPKALDYFIDRPLKNQSDGAAAFTKLPDGRFLLAAGSRRTPIDFYISTTTSLDTDPGFKHIQKIEKDSKGKKIQIFQNLGFLNQCDGRVFVAGTRRGVHNIPWMGKNILDLYEVLIDSKGLTIEKVSSKSLPAKDVCDFDAAAGTHISKDGQIEIYCTDFLNNGSDEGHGTCEGQHSMRAALFTN